VRLDYKAALGRNEKCKIYSRLHMCICMHMCICIHMRIYIYIYIYNENSYSFVCCNIYAVSLNAGYTDKGMAG